jgi:hypothetical protein
MKSKICASIAVALLTACASPPPPPDIAKNLFEVEAASRKVEPQKEVGLLYVLSPATTNERPNSLSLKIDGEPAMSGNLSDNFYVFCLPPGRHELAFYGTAEATDTIKVEPGRIYARQYKSWASSFLIFLAVGSQLSEMSTEGIKDAIASRRIGTDSTYYNSRHRCRALS